MGKDGKDTLLGPEPEHKTLPIPKEVKEDDPFVAFDGLISYLLDQILQKHRKGEVYDESTVDLLKQMVEIRRILNE